MKKSIARPFFALALVSAFAAAVFAQEPPAGSPVARHGQLKVAGNRILDENGEPVQLRGMSLYWSIGPGGRDFYNADVVKYIRDEWNATLIRAAMGVEDKWGVGNDQAGYLNGNNSGGVGNEVRVASVVDGAIEHGMYVIIDWHSHKANQYQQQSVQFFQEMAAAYKDYPNVIYEIFNEPTDQVWATAIKPYAQAVVDAIRAIDPKNLILIGTRQWCQLPDEAAKDSVKGEHLAYVMHFYAGSHKDDIRNNTFRALRAGKAVFVSEFGTVNANGNGTPDIASSDIWMDFMDQFKLSWANWSLAALTETSAALKTGASTTPGAGGASWGDNNLSASGIYIRDRLKSPPSAVKKFYTLTADVVGEGTVARQVTGTGPGGGTSRVDANRVFYTGDRDSTFTLVATPAQGDWTFTGWSVNGEDKGSAATIQVTAGGSADVAVTATFYSPSASTLPAASRGKAAQWSVKRTSGGIVLRGPETGTAEIRFYDMRGKQVGRFLRKGASDGQPIIINNFKIPAGNYLITVKDKVSNKEVYRTKMSFVR